MNKRDPHSRSFMQTRRSLLLLPLAFVATRLAAESSVTTASTPVLPPGACPLNSGGPSLLGTRWRLASVYGNQVPPELEITMEVGEDSLKGFAGCNQYTANFKRVGHTGFKMVKIDKGREGCPIISTGEGMPTINVGDWEGSYLRTLGRAGSVQQEGPILQFYNLSGEKSVIFAKKYGDAGISDSGSGSAVPAADKPEAGVVAAPAAVEGDSGSLLGTLSKFLSGKE
ncbi:MAG TPA: META domain-containing protein [Candidatus Thiothrix moscowensis]|uniref:META domain-containing protein n=1 Tax=unclassified Thiothrix TaxID=2636184 RepID=UPI0025E4DBA6|nr:MULTISPECIES: META domain-containing protein [unclassified Thiothrix]HRJ52454.1 META domain-containing protein [Candidatus Thiothrix moscowensis]HRJ93360.1 META domain-containing protein [Candidatus Thiothrix moscowensis]